MFAKEADGHFECARDALIAALRAAIATAPTPPCRNSRMEWLTFIATLEALSQVAAEQLGRDDVRLSSENEAELTAYLYSALARNLALVRRRPPQAGAH